MIVGYLGVNKNKVQRTTDIKKIVKAMKDRKRRLWVNIENPTKKDYGVMEERFGFHPLTIEDIQNPSQRPKVDNYTGYSFITVRAWGQKTNPQLNMYLSRSFLVTVTTQPIAGVDEVIERFEKNPSALLRGHDFVAYSVLDTLLDQLFPVVRKIDDDLETLEEKIFESAEQKHLRKLLHLKKRLNGMKKLLWPMRDILSLLSRGQSEYIQPKTVPYFMDLHDHNLRLIELIDSARDKASTAMDAHLSVSSNNLNEVMKVLTIFAAIVVIPTMIASIYGMNFVNPIPAFNDPNGFMIAMAMMVLLSGILLLHFKRKGWI